MQSIQNDTHNLYILFLNELEYSNTGSNMGGTTTTTTTNGDTVDRDTIETLFQINFKIYDESKSTLMVLSHVLESLALALQFMKMRHNNENFWDTRNDTIHGSESVDLNALEDLNAVFTTTQARILTCIWKNV